MEDRRKTTTMESSSSPDIPESLEKHTVRLAQNLSRVDSLLDLHDFTQQIIDHRRQKATVDPSLSTDRLPDPGDVLRSATVLLHACLEDFLRTIALEYIPRTSSDLLKNIPLSGVGNINQTKYTLSDLAVHCGKQVDAIIDQSIDEWLHRQSFNDTVDISCTLRHIGIEPKTCNADFDLIDQMIKRRHRIVHNADRPGSADSTDGAEVNPIVRHVVADWRGAVEKFMKAVLRQLYAHEEEEGHTST